MKQVKTTVESSLLSRVIDRVQAENLPIQITTGRKFKDGMGDVQIEALFEFEPEDTTVFHQLINDTINSMVNT